MARLVWLEPWSAAIGVKTLIGNMVLVLVLVEFMMKTGVLFWWWWWCWLVVVMLFLLEWRWLTSLI